VKTHLVVLGASKVEKKGGGYGLWMMRFRVKTRVAARLSMVIFPSWTHEIREVHLWLLLQ